MKRSPDQMLDAAVIGGNFAGLQAALYLLRARRRVVLFDDGQPRNRFAAHSHGFLGHDGLTPATIQANALAQLRAYPTLTVVAARVLTVETGFRLGWDGGEVQARRLILATGQRDILPDLPGHGDAAGADLGPGYRVGRRRWVGAAARFGGMQSGAGSSG